MRPSVSTMAKSNVKKWRLLIGFLFLHHLKIKVIQADTANVCTPIVAAVTNPRVSTECTSTECRLEDIYPVPSDEDTHVDPEQDCYRSGDVVCYVCYGDLKGRYDNKCALGSWMYSDGPACIADCPAPSFSNGILIPDIPRFRNGEEMAFECNENYTLVGVSLIACDDGDFDPPNLPMCYGKCLRPFIPNSDATSTTPLLNHGQDITVTCSLGYSNGESQSATSICNNGTLEPTVPLCYAQCSRPMIPNSDATSPSPAIDHGGVLVVTCDVGYSNGQTESATSVCNDGTLDPVVPFCFAQCERPIIPNSDSTSDLPGLHHGDTITVTCDSGYSSEHGKSTTSVCKDGVLIPSVPHCFAQCERPIIPNSDAISSTPAINHGDGLTVTCNNGYSNGQWILSTTVICNHGTLIPAVPSCYAQCQRPIIQNSDASSASPPVDHGGALVVTCDAGFSNGQTQSTTSVCYDGNFNPVVSPCYGQCKRPVIPNSDATSATPVLDHGSTLTVTCTKGYSNGQSPSMSTTCINGTLNPSVQLCYAQCYRPVIPNSDATSATPALNHGDPVIVTCNTGYSNGNSESASSLCYDGTLTPAMSLCYAKCSRPAIPNSDSDSSAPLLNHGDALTVTCDTGYSNGQSHTTTSICYDGTFDPPVPLCYNQCHRPVILHSNATSEYPILNHGEEMVVQCNAGYSNGQSVIMSTMCNNGTLNPPVPSCRAQCNRPSIPDSDATSLYPVLDHGDTITVTCNDGYSNGHSASTETMCNDGLLIPPVPFCYAQCSRPVVPNSNATSSSPALHHGDSLIVTCNDGYSNGQAQSSTSLCYQGTLGPVPVCYAQCNRPVIPHSDVTSSYPALNHGEVIIVRCNSGYSNGQSQASTSVCNHGALYPPVPLCHAQCNKPVIANSDATSPYPVLHHGEAFTVTCNTGYSNGQAQTMTSVCMDGALNLALPVCYAQCNRVVIPNSDATSSTPNLHHGEVITVTCNTGYSNGYSDSTTSVCSQGTFTPPLPHCYAQCNRPVIPNSDAASSTPPLHHNELFVLTCNTGYSTWQSQTSSSMCSDGELKPDVPICYAQCNRPVIPNSDGTSSTPALHNGDTVTITCDDGYTNGNSKTTTSICDHGILDPVIPPCYAQCSRPIIPNSDSTSSNPLLSHGSTITVTCNTGYSNGQSQISTSTCGHGTLNPAIPFCLAQCDRPIIANSDATSPHPVLHHGEAFTVTCNTGYSNGQALSMTSICMDGIINIALPFCYAQCSRPIIPNSNAMTSSPPIHHGEALTVTCDEGYSDGQAQSTMSVCSHGIFNPTLPSCYADCQSLEHPNNGRILTGSDPFHHREVAIFECDEHYSLEGNQEIYCYDGLWNSEPPLCLESCTRPVVPNSDAISPTPLVPHGSAMTVSCDYGYSNGDKGRTVLICNDGTLSPDVPSCTKTRMAKEDIAAVVLGTLGTALSLVAIAVDIYLAKNMQDISKRQDISNQQGT